MKWIRKALKGISLTAAMFVFQACYGTMESYYDTKVTFHVVDDNGAPLKDVAIWAQELYFSDSSYIGDNSLPVEYTDENGMATWWTNESLQKFTFTDKDSLYTPVDTIVHIGGTDSINIVLKKA